MQIAYEPARFLKIIAFLSATGACIPDLTLKADTTGGGGSSSGACVARPMAEWRFNSEFQEGLGGTLTDLDGDGFGDAAISNELSNNTQVYWGAESYANVVQATPRPTTRPRGQVAAAKLTQNQGARLDLVVPSVLGVGLTILRQTSPRVWIASWIDQKNQGQVVVADVNEDGFNDLLIKTSKCYWLRPGDGKGGFPGAGDCYTGINADADVQAGDMDGDGVPELVIHSADTSLGDTPLADTWTIAKPTAKGTVPRNSIALGLLANYKVGFWTVSDIDGDGKSEVVVLANSPEGTPSPPAEASFLVTHSGSVSSESLAFDKCIPAPFPTNKEGFQPKQDFSLRGVGDVNGDKKLDLLFVATCSFCKTVNTFMVSTPGP